MYADQFPFTQAEVKLIPEAAWNGASDSDEARTARLAGIIAAIPDDSLLDLYTEMAALPSLESGHRRYLSSRPDLLREIIAGAISHLLPTEGRSLMALQSWHGVHEAPVTPKKEPSLWPAWPTLTRARVFTPGEREHRPARRAGRHRDRPMPPGESWRKDPQAGGAGPGRAGG